MLFNSSPYSMLRARRTLHSSKNRQLELDHDTLYPFTEPSPYATSGDVATFFSNHSPEDSQNLKMSATVTSSSSASAPSFLNSGLGHLSLLGLPQGGTLPTEISSLTDSSCSSPLVDKGASKKSGKQKKSVPKDLTQANFGNDFSSAFAKYGILPQTWVRNIEEPFNGYPKLRLLHEIKAEHNRSHSAPPVGISCKGALWNLGGQTEKLQDLPEKINSMRKQSVQFDVIMIHGCIEEWPEQVLRNMNIESIAARPSLLYFWVPSNRIDEGRALMNKWGFRRGEDITYMVSSLDSVHAPKTNTWVRDSSLFVPTTWHCLMGLKGTLRRTSDTALINCNVDTDVIIEKTGQRANVVPEQIYEVVENFTNMRRKLHIIPARTPESLPVRLRPGWVIMGPSVMPCGNFEAKRFQNRSLIPVHPDVEVLRPQTPPTR